MIIHFFLIINNLIYLASYIKANTRILPRRMVLVETDSPACIAW